MKVKSSKFTDSGFHSLVDRMEGVIEGYLGAGYEIIAVTMSSDQGRHYGVIFYRAKP